MSLLDKIKKFCTIKEAATLSKSTFFTDIDETATDVYAMNIALSGTLMGGFKSGIISIAGPSRHFKSLQGLIMASAYLKKHPDAVLFFADSEFGTPSDYFQSVGIDPNRVWHVPVKNLEQLKFELTRQLEELTKGEKLFIMIDSIGGLASLKEAEDALDGKSVADMSRAKFLKGLYRIITPYLRIKDVPLVQILHTYEEQKMYGKTIISGGQGVLLASDVAIIMGRRQEKDGSELLGYQFVMNVDKSRYVREKTSIPITVTFEGGINKWSGLLDIALGVGMVVKPSNGWYSRVDDNGVVEDKKYRIKDTENAEFWGPLLRSTVFSAKIEERYKLSTRSVSDEEIDQAMESNDED